MIGEVRRSACRHLCVASLLGCRLGNFLTSDLMGFPRAHGFAQNGGYAVGGEMTCPYALNDCNEHSRFADAPQRIQTSLSSSMFFLAVHPHFRHWRHRRNSETGPDQPLATSFSGPVQLPRSGSLAQHLSHQYKGTFIVHL